MRSVIARDGFVYITTYIVDNNIVLGVNIKCAVREGCQGRHPHESEAESSHCRRWGALESREEEKEIGN